MPTDKPDTIERRNGQPVPTHITGPLDADGFTAKERAFIDAFLSGAYASAADCARQAGYSTPNRAAYAVLQRPRVRDYIHAKQMVTIETEGTALAWKTLQELMRPDMPPSVRLGAASKTLDTADKARKDRETKDIDQKEIEDMTPDEIDAFIAKAESILDKAHAKNGTLLDITPEKTEKTTD